jgi:dynein heavy chain
MMESNLEVYKIGKLSKFMTTVKFMMQDSLRTMVLSSLNEYAKAITAVTSQKITILSTNCVKITNSAKPMDKEYIPKKPLFAVDLLYKMGKLYYNLDFENFEGVLVALFEKACTVTENLPQLESLVIDQIFWAQKAILQGVHSNEKSVKKCLRKLQHAIKEGLLPLNAYLKHYERHMRLLNLDIAQFAAKYEAENFTLAEMQADIIKFAAEWESLDLEIPGHINLGLFFVNCESVRSAIRKDLGKVVLEIISKRAAKMATSMSLTYQQIYSRLKEKPTKIEELIELRNYLQEVPQAMFRLKKQVTEMLEMYDVLESHRFDSNNEDCRARWTAFGWNGKIEELMIATELSMAADEAAFARSLQTDQEIFKDRVNTLRIVIADFARHSDLSRTSEVVNEVNRISNELKEVQNLANLFNSREKLFNLEPKKYDEVGVLLKDFEPYKNLWLTAHDWSKWRDQWMLGNFTALDADTVEKSLMNALRSSMKAIKQFKNALGPMEAANKIKDEMEDFKPYLPLIQALRNPGMRDRHWDRLSEELGMRLMPDDKYTLSHLLSMQLMEKIDIISKVCEVAGKEYSIEEALDKMDTEWKLIELEFIAYKDTGTFIMKASDDVIRMLDDHIVMAQSMGFSPYKKPFADRILQWENKLKLVQEVLDSWMECQRSWLYLEPIFSSEDITIQLPTEAKRFSTMDRLWRKIMSQSRQRPNVIDCCADSKLLDTFKECNKLLEMVAKGLSAYLESKRISFPRFFFLSDDELLQILSQTKDPTAVQPHLRKCFENIASLLFSPPNNQIVAMFSGEGEKIDFETPFFPVGPVEKWLLQVEDQMKKSVRRKIQNAIASYQSLPRAKWVLSHPGQAVLGGSQAFWTKEVSEALKSSSLKVLLSKLLSQLQDLVTLVRGDLQFLNRLILGDLIVLDVHNRDLVKRLIDNNIESEKDFEWISQLRYYWQEDELVVKIVNASFNYGYEYLGNTGRLVITPLTDRCYLTLTGAMHLGMGGAPAGPAGTGKTETVKDLAKALAKQCVVFNCSDQLDYLAMAKFFKGLAASGAWACFDEFNRIDIEVLSVIAQQITTIQKACTAGQTRFLFEGVDLPLDSTNAIFITMNPGYAGRTELPDNLKALFRPVAMMIPNYAMIGEISLFSFGFSDAKVLSEKMAATFRLSSEQLSSQDHYDFGMRAVKTVISSAGNLKRENPDLAEDLILLRALNDVNLPKFLADDVPLFNGIISDLFPGVRPQSIDYNILISAMQASCEKLDLEPNDSFLRKCIQLYETIVVRHGLMLVGPSGGGKSSCIRVLSKALTALAGQKAPNGTIIQKIKTLVLNPKSITMGQLYGEFDQQTHEWSDGILSFLMREGTQDTSLDRKWYIFDGPVDAVWVESMNTLLDDNKKLCLSSGEIIKMTAQQTMMFEVADLAFASPATVSRCGMIYMEPEALGTAPLVSSWIKRQSNALGEQYFGVFLETINTLFENYLDAAFEFWKKSVKELVPTSPGNLTASLGKILQSLLLNSVEVESQGNRIEVADFKELIEPSFIFALIWSVGVTSNLESRSKFDIWIRGVMDEKKANFKIPSSGTVYDFVFSAHTLKWVNWMDTISDSTENFKPSDGAIVPTIDTVRHTFLIDLLMMHNFPVLMTGATGTGKTVTIQEKLFHGLDQTWTPICINFSARTSANQTQDLLDSKMEKRRKGVYGPPSGKRFAIFIDDLNMPQLDICNAQPSVELIRQWMDYNGWYDRSQIGKFMEIVDITFICAMGPPGGGRNVITSRLTRHFNLINVIDMDDNSLQRIFSTILGSFVSKFSPEVSRLTDSLVDASIHVYNTIRGELLPTPTKSHYTFNLRDLGKVINGLLNADIKTVNTQADICRLWIHESMRVFQDRLVDNIDKSWFKDLINTTLTEKLQIDWNDIVTNEPLLFGDYLIPGADPKIYIEVKVFCVNLGY